MKQNNWLLKTRAGLMITVRPANESDDGILQKLFHRVRPEDLRFRFLTGMKEVSANRIHDMTHVDHRSVETYIAFIEDEPDAVATAMLASDAKGGRGEVAISVRADRRGQGIGWALLAFVARQAAARGMKVIQSMESRENHDAIALERDMGFKSEPYPDDASLVLLSKDLAVGEAKSPSH